jgi:hypothetical protein
LIAPPCGNRDASGRGNVADVGYAYSVYAVDLKKLKPPKGKAKIKKLFDELKEKHGADIRESDEWFDHYIVEQGAPIRLRALWELLHGTCSQKQWGFQYGYCLELLCKQFGRRIDETSLTWFDDVLDPVLKRARCPATKRLLGKGAFPLPIPAPKDFPEIGTVTAAGCISGLRAMSKVRALVVPDDENLVMVVDEVTQWFQRAKAAKQGLVTFVY